MIRVEVDRFGVEGRQSSIIVVLPTAPPSPCCDPDGGPCNPACPYAPWGAKS